MADRTIEQISESLDRLLKVAVAPTTATFMENLRPPNQLEAIPIALGQPNFIQHLIQISDGLFGKDI
jgi:hypothetical protein